MYAAFTSREACDADSVTTGMFYVNYLVCLFYCSALIHLTMGMDVLCLELFMSCYVVNRPFIFDLISFFWLS